MSLSTTSPTTGAMIERRAGLRQWLGLTVIALPCFLYSLDLTVLNLAVPAMSAALHPTSLQLLWIMDIYGFVLASMLTTMGALGDRIGRRRLLLLGSAAFGVASVLAAFSSSASSLIATRAALGIAGATLAPSTLSLIRHMFPDPHDRGVAIGAWVASFSAGSALGPVVGGVLLEYFWWGSVFLVAVPVMVLILVLGPWVLPEHRNPHGERIDIMSAMLSLTTVLAVLFGLKCIAQYGFTWPYALWIALGLVLGRVFVRRQLQHPAPMIDMRLLRARRFTIPLSTYALACFVYIGLSVLVSQYMQLVLGMSPLEAGLWTLPTTAASIGGSIMTPLIARRLPPTYLIVSGLGLAAVGFVMLGRMDGSTTPLSLAAARCVYALGLAPVFTLATSLMLGSAPLTQSGAASAISETGSEFGGALGIALLGSLCAVIYRIALNDAIPPSHHIGPAIFDSLGAATDMAHRIGGALGSGLLDASRTAFVLGLQVAAWVSVIVLVGTAALVARGLPQDPGDNS